MTAFLFGAGDFPMDSMFHTALISFIYAHAATPRVRFEALWCFGAQTHGNLEELPASALSKETFAFAVKILTPQAGQAGASLPNMRDMISVYSFRIVYTTESYIIYIE